MFARTTGRLFTGTFKALFGDFDGFVRIVWAWYALVAVLAALGQLVGGESPVVAAVVTLVWLCSSASIAVAWHRNLLLGERPAAFNLTFGRREIAYLLKTLLIALIAAVPALVLITLASALVTVGVVALSALVVLAVFLVLPPIMRLCLVLPATALDEPLGFGEAFSRSAGLGVPMALAGVATGLCVGALDLGLTQLAGLLGGGAAFGAIAVFILSLGLQIAMTALQIGILTGGYYILRERQMAPPAHTPPD